MFPGSSEEQHAFRHHSERLDARPDQRGLARIAKSEAHVHISPPVASPMAKT